MSDILLVLAGGMFLLAPVFIESRTASIVLALVILVALVGTH